MSDSNFQSNMSKVEAALRSLITNSDELLIQAVLSGKLAPITIAALQAELETLKRLSKNALVAVTAAKEVSDGKSEQSD